MLRDRTILIAVLIQLFIASFSSALLLGLLSLYDADTIMQVGGSNITIGMVGDASAAPLGSLLRAHGLKTLDFASLSDAQAAFYKNKVIAVFSIPSSTGGVLQIKLYLPGNSEAADTLVRMVVQEPLKQYENLLRAQHGIQVHYTGLTGKPATAFEFIYSVLLPMLMFFPAFVAGSMTVDSLTEEVENNTLQTLLSAPITLNSMIAAKVAAAVLLAVLQCIAWLGLLWMNAITIQNPALVLLLAAIVAAIAASLAAGTACLFRDRERTQFIYSLGLVAAMAISTLLGFSPVTILARLATGDPFIGGWQVAAFALLLGVMWIILPRISRHLAA